jgi:plasmid stabilization system protein ParE
MRIIIDPEAADDLDGIFDWLAKRNQAAALELIRRIRERIGRLGSPGLSHMGRFGTVTGTRELVETDYIVVYTVDDLNREILVLAIFHSKQDHGYERSV